MFAKSVRAADPGLPLPYDSGLNDQKPGSVLFYNLVTSSASGSTSQNTRVTLTNTSSTSAAFVHFFLVNGQTGRVATDLFACFTPSQTAGLLASEVSPGVTGYVIGVAVDNNGCPVSHNFLLGDAYVKLSSGHAARLSAVAIAARFSGSRAACNPTLVFDGSADGYDPFPRELLMSDISSRADGNETLLVINRFGGSLVSGIAPIGSVSGHLYGQSGNVYDFSSSIVTPQLISTLSNNFPVTVPNFESAIPAGRRGSLSLQGAVGVGLLGAVINFNSGASTTRGAFTGGQNLRLLTPASTVSLTIPIIPPNC
jgi:hypothetical protein